MTPVAFVAISYSSTITVKKVIVLYVEGEPTDVMFLRRALAFAQLPVELLTVSDAQFAIEWLKGTVPYSDRVAYPLPDLIITELKLPCTSGFELLRFVRNDARFRDVPVVVYSKCEFPSEAENSVRLGALAFFRKSNCCGNLLDFLRGWLAIRWEDEIDAERTGKIPPQTEIVADALDRFNEQRAASQPRRPGSKVHQTS